MLSLADFAAALKHRIRLELAIFLAVMLVVGLFIVMSPRIYSSTATLLFEAGAVDPVQGGRIGDDNLATLLSTQSDVIKSDLVGARVVNDLGLVTPDVLVQWRNQTGGVGDINLWYGELILNNLTVVPDRVSRVVQVNYKSQDPKYSAAMANAFVKAYLDQKLEIQTDPAKTYSRWFGDRTREVRMRLEETQGRLTAFKRRTGIVDSNSTDAESSRMAELQSAVTGAEVGTADIGARSSNSISQSSDVQNSGVVSGLRASVAAKAAQVSQLSVALGPNHPDRQAAEAELAEMRAKLNAAVAEQSTSIRVANAAARSKEATLRSTLNSQKSRMLTLAADRAEFDVLTRDVESARQAYDQVTQKLDAMRLSAVAPTSGVRQLDTARPTLLPSQPNIPLLLLMGTALAGLLAVGVGVLIELIRPVVRSANTLQQTTGVPVITTINFGKSSAGQQNKSDEMAA